jgi:hypothetical protein
MVLMPPSLDDPQRTREPVTVPKKQNNSGT